MFQSFSGSTRQKRQVNLSGHNKNPFTAYSNSNLTSSPRANSNALAQIQQDRIIRQQDRERPRAATRIQKTWRGYRSRTRTRGLWRSEWDALESWDSTRMTEEYLLDAASSALPYASESQCLVSLGLLIHFVSVRNEHDRKRIYYFISRYLKSIPASPAHSPNSTWTHPLLRLSQVAFNMLSRENSTKVPIFITNRLLFFLQAVAATIPSRLSLHSQEYFNTLAAVGLGPQNLDVRLVEGCAAALLDFKNPEIELAYDGFVTEFLTTPDLPTLLGGLDRLASHVDYSLLSDTVSKILSFPQWRNWVKSKSRESLLWLLGYFIFFRRWSYSNKLREANSSDFKYVTVVAKLISFFADDLSTRMEPIGASSTAAHAKISSRRSAAKALPDFVRSELSTLVTQENVTGLLTNFEITPKLEADKSSLSEDASALADYALTLLRAFPRRGDEIRMWLYRGSTTQRTRDRSNTKALPAIKYYYQAASRTSVFRLISKDPKETVNLLQPDKSGPPSNSQSVLQSLESRDQQWRVILLFLELYTFVLKVMDDEEFLSGSMSSSDQWSWTRQSALPLDQVKDLTVFLKNLAFAMYWNASDIAGIEATETKTSLAEIFGGTKPAQSDKSQDQTPAKFAEMSVAGVSGMTLTYIKGMVTGVLRMVYERDSRRKFMPRDHWLMTNFFEMDRFIAAVVEEEDRKHQIEESYSQDGEVNDRDDDLSAEDDAAIEHSLVGTQHTQRVRNVERLQRQQRKASRRKYLESVTPRLEILQNMPFFIPFATRVQIFRKFVHLDQKRRRGTTDPDHWRFNMMHSPTGNIGRHQAKVRRENIFDDAFSHFYELGEGLKEPIQIRFVDKFDTIEEGIDGGGVTKEFLTSITNEAFSASHGLEALFIENDQNLLYPNPTSLEERKATLQQALIKENSPDWNESVRDLLRRYEFLGRIVGKCLYEGILIDIHFAPFFLLKWALTGGSSNASKESSYRANINDLRDLDEGLYQGLLQLKNYTGNVDDFSLNFAVTDTIRTSPTTTKSVTRELIRHGEKTTVTNENRLVYISYMARYRLQVQPAAQTSAFLRGLGTIISPSWLSMFNQSELQTLVGGSSSSIDITDLRNNTLYGGLYAIGDDGLEHPSVQLFWKVMEDLDDAERKKVLKFVTSTPRAPLLGFGNLNPRFSIRDSGNDQTRLPSTSTCVNLLKLPVYKDEKVLRERLLYSVNAGAGFNLS